MPLPDNDNKRCIKRLRARFERWELSHLRELAADLANRLEEAERRADIAQSWAAAADHRADMFQELNNELQTELQEATGHCPQLGLTQAGELVLLQGGAA